MLTIYLSSSDHHLTSKDSALVTTSSALAHTRLNGKADRDDADETQPLLPHSPRATESRTAVRPRKIMYYAAGSGIPEIKCILSGAYLYSRGALLME